MHRSIAVGAEEHGVPRVSQEGGAGRIPPARATRR